MQIGYYIYDNGLSLGLIWFDFIMFNILTEVYITIFLTLEIPLTSH